MGASDDDPDLRQAILERIALDEVFASEMAEAAHDLAAQGNYGFAAALIDMSRRHQVRSICARAEFAAMTHRRTIGSGE